MTSKGRNSKGKAAIRKAEVGKDTNITMCSDLSILSESILSKAKADTIFDPKNYPKLFIRGKSVKLWFTNII